MKKKLEQVNQSYKKAISQIIRKEFPAIVELTVSDVLVDPSYQHGRAWLKTTPEVLEEVMKKRGDIQTQLQKYVKTRYTPRFTYVLDEGEIDKLDSLFEQVRNTE